MNIYSGLNGPFKFSMVKVLPGKPIINKKFTKMIKFNTEMKWMEAGMIPAESWKFYKEPLWDYKL